MGQGCSYHCDHFSVGHRVSPLRLKLSGKLSHAAAADVGGRITGTVKDQTDAAIEGVGKPNYYHERAGRLFPFPSFQSDSTRLSSKWTVSNPTERSDRHRS